ncbi:MAG: hypothetical protein EBU31_00470 [Proteobacteria bacterium]|nr:hypothetical protein [Pseudomonadota bacterium]
MTTQQIGIQLKANGAQAVITDIRKVADTMQRLDAASAIATRGLTSLAGGFRVLSGVAVTGGVAAGLTGIVRGLDALNDAADATGASLNNLAGLERLARINGGNLDQVTSAIVKLNQQLNGSDGSDSKSAIALKALGLEVDKLKQLDPADAIVQVGRALNQFADDGDKARLAQILFGKSLRELAPLLNDIGASTGEYAVESAKAAQEAEKFAKNAAQLGFVFEGFGRSLVGPVLEGLNAFIDRVRVAQRAGQGLAGSLIGAGLLGEGDLGNAERALANAQSDLGRAQNPEVRANLERRINELNRQLVEERRRMGLDQPAAPRPSVAGSVADAERAAEAEKKLEATRKTSADAAKRLAEEERKRREGIAIELADQKLLLALVMQGNDVDEARLRIQLARKGLTAPEIEETIRLKAAVEELIDAKKLAAEAEEAEIKRRQEIIDSAFAQEQAVAAQVKSVEEQIISQLQQNETLGLTGVALAEVEAARLRDAAAEALRRAEVLESDAVSQAEAGRVRELAARYNELADAKLAGALKAADIEKAKGAIEAQQREASDLQKIFDDVGKSLTDSLFRGFESGKSFARSFKDAIVNSFKSLVVRFIAQPVLSGISGSIAGAFGFSGAAQAGQDAAGGFGGGFLNALSGGKTIFDALSGGLTSGLTSFATTLGNAGFSSGAQFINGFSSALNGGSAATFSGASSAFNLGNFAGQAAPFIPAVLSLLQGDFKGAAFSGGGAAIGSFFGGPVGGAIGSVIGSLVGGLFGGGGTPHKGGTFGVSADAGRILDGRNLSGAKNNGFTDAEFGKIRSASTGISAIGDALKPVVQQFAASLSLLTQTNIKVAAGIGADGEDASQAFFRVTEAGKQLAYNVTEFSKDLKKGAEEFAKLLQGGALAFAVQQSSAEQFIRDAFSQFNVTKTDKKTGATVFDSKAAKAIDPAAVQAVAQAVNALKALSPALASLNVTAAQVVATGKDASTLSANTAALQALLTPQELVTAQTNTLSAQFKALGLSLPSSAQGLRDLVTGIDKSTESGKKLFGSVLGLVQPFLQLQQAIESVNGSAQAATEALMQQAIAGATSRDDALRRLAIVQNGGVLPEVPGFASGGDFGGGIALVGERGPELISTGPARIFNAQQTGQMLAPANDESAAEVKALRADLRASQTAIASLQSRMVRLFERWDSTGLPEVRAL